jgi:hypothetical protein
VAGAVILWRRRGPLLVLGLWAPLAVFTAATAFGSTRYRIAAEVSVVILAAVTIDAVIRALRKEPPPPPDRPGARLAGAHPDDEAPDGGRDLEADPGRGPGGPVPVGA